MLKILQRIARRLDHGRNTPKVIQGVQTAALTYLEEAALLDIYQAVEASEKNKIPGVLIEAGCALGGSAIVIASAKSPIRPLYIYDVFGMIPPPSDEDEEDVHTRYETIKSGKSEGISGNKYYGYEDDLVDTVTKNFEKFQLSPEKSNVHLIKGLFQDTLYPPSEVALAHIDGDWYESVLVCLQRIVPLMPVGGVLIIDDYQAWSGCRKAVDHYFEQQHNKFEFIQKARLHIRRKI